MRDTTLLRLAGLCAIAGGLVRIANVFTMGMLEPRALLLVYFLTDVLLIFGLTGIYLNCRKSVGIAGLIGFAVAVIGLLMVRSSVIFNYPLAAAVTLLGTIILGAAMLTDRSLPRAAPLLWFVSLVAGIAGALLPQFALGNAIAGAAFGAGFVAAGMSLFRAARS